MRLKYTESEREREREIERERERERKEHRVDANVKITWDGMRTLI